MGGSSSRSTNHHFDAQDDECPRHLELAPCGRLRARVGELLRAVEGVGDPGTWPVRLQSAGRRIGAMGPWGEPVLRQQSRRAVASGAKARPVASGPATDLAGCARPSRCAPRATRGQRPESSRRLRASLPPPATSSRSHRSNRSRAQILPAGPRTRLTPPLRGLRRMTSLRASLTAPGSLGPGSAAIVRDDAATRSAGRGWVTHSPHHRHLGVWAP